MRRVIDIVREAVWNARANGDGAEMRKMSSRDLACDLRDRIDELEDKPLPQIMAAVQQLRQKGQA